MKWVFSHSFWLIMVLIQALPVRAEPLAHVYNDKITADPAADDERVCEYLKEKIDIFVALHESVSEDFTRVSDKQLCHSMSAQCEYFHKKAIEYQKLYKKECDDHFLMMKIAKCDYSANQCEKASPRPNSPLFHANANNSRW